MSEQTYTYQCAACKKPVLMEQGVVKRDCEHADAAVIAQMSAVAYGVSKAVS